MLAGLSACVGVAVVLQPLFATWVGRVHVAYGFETLTGLAKYSFGSPLRHVKYHGAILERAFISFVLR